MNIFDDYKFWWKVFLQNIDKKVNGSEIVVDGVPYVMKFVNGPRSGGRYEVEFRVARLFTMQMMFSFDDEKTSTSDPVSWESHYLKFGEDAPSVLEQYLILLRMGVD